MYNILVVSEDPAPFDELTDSFRKDFFEIETKELSTFENNFEELKHYDFVLLHLISESEEEKKKIIHIKNHCYCPLYVFSNVLESHQITSFLELGAEGHIDIPFNSQVVLSRIKAVLRYLHQVKRSAPNTLRYGRLILHLDNHEVFIDNTQIPLTNVEFKIFMILVEHRETVVSKDKIIRYVWDEDRSATDNALGIHITRLRKKINCDPKYDIIETVWGLGYRLNLSVCEKSNK